MMREQGEQGAKQSRLLVRWHPIGGDPNTIPRLDTSQLGEFPSDQRGQDGAHAIALWNPGDQLFYLWVKDNF